MAEIQDITETEQRNLQSRLQERCGREVQGQLANTDSAEPAGQRSHKVFGDLLARRGRLQRRRIKAGDRSYRCRFLYRGYQQFDTGVHEHGDLSECIVSLLQAWEDHSADEREDLGSKIR